MEEKDIANVKAKTLDLCLKCEKELKTVSLGGGGGIFDVSGSGRAAFYCENKDCSMYGYLTLARIARSEKIEEDNK